MRRRHRPDPTNCADQAGRRPCDARIWRLSAANSQALAASAAHQELVVTSKFTHEMTTAEANAA